MNYKQRYGVQFAIVFTLLIPVILSGCILVVEEDGHRDRHRYAGTDWYLEVVIFGVRSIAPANQDVALTFVDETRFEGESRCGPFSGSYSVDDKDGVSIDSFSSSVNSCGLSEASSIFVSKLPATDHLTREDHRLKAEFGATDYMLFVQK